MTNKAPLPDAPATPSVPSRTDSKHSQSSEEQTNGLAARLFQYSRDLSAGRGLQYADTHTMAADIREAAAALHPQEQEQQQTGEPDYYNPQHSPELGCHMVRVKDGWGGWIQRRIHEELLTALREAKRENDGLIRAVADHVTVRGEYLQRAEAAESSLRAAQQQRDEILEEAARVCVDMIERMKQHRNGNGEVTGADFYAPEIDALEEAAAAIRSLKSAQQK